MADDFERELKQIEEIRRLQLLMAEEEEKIRIAEERRKEQEAKVRKKEAKKKAKAEKERKRKEKAAKEEAERLKREKNEEERRKKAADLAAKQQAEVARLEAQMLAEQRKAKKLQKQQEIIKRTELAVKKAKEQAVKRAAAESRYASLLEAQVIRTNYKPPASKEKHGLLFAQDGNTFASYKQKIKADIEGGNTRVGKNNKVMPLRLLTQKGKASPFLKDIKNRSGPLFNKEADEFKKTNDDLKFLREQFEIHPLLKGLIPSQVNKLIEAFEKVYIPKPGDKVAERGKEDDSFFIIQNGEVLFEDENGKNVGTAGIGRSFGESALTYSSNRSVSIKTKQPKTILWKLSQEHYKTILHDIMIKSEEDRLKTLRKIHNFRDIDEQDLKNLCTAMKPHVFHNGENLTETFGDVPYCCLVKDGTVEIDPRLSPDIRCLGKVIGGSSNGATFGMAFAAQRTAVGSFKTDTKCLTDGVAYLINQEIFEQVFGSIDKMTENLADKKVLKDVKAIKDAKLSDSDMDRLVRSIIEVPWDDKKVIFEDNKPTSPTLYIIRRGNVKINDKRMRRQEVMGEGRFFGHEHFMMRQGGIPKSVRAYYTATAKKHVVLGMLHLQDLAAILGKKPNVSVKKHIPSEDLVRHRILGEGQYGTVWLVTNKQNPEIEPYALKIQLLEDPTRKDPKKCIMEEIAVMEAIQSPFVIQVLSTYEEEDSIDMLLSLAPGGELFDVIHQEDEDGEWKSGVGEENGRFYSAIIADCIAFLHRQKYAFRDLKPENVLIDADGYPVITDFGFAKVVEDKTYTFCGTPNYVAPEIISNRGYGVSADNFSLGILIYEVIDGDNPFFEEGMDQTVLYQAIMNEPHYPLNKDQYSQDLRDLIDGLLEKDPSSRLGTFRESDILAHKFFSKYTIDELRNKTIKAPWIPDPIRLEEDSDEEEDW